MLHNRRSDRFPYGFERALTPEERVVTLWWEGSFAFEERVFLITAEELDPYLADYVRANRGRQLWRTHLTGRAAALSRRLRRGGS